MFNVLVDQPLQVEFRRQAYQPSRWMFNVLVDQPLQVELQQAGLPALQVDVQRAG
jgi:hypothetical protein